MIPYEDMFVEPFYQLMRQQLLAHNGARRSGRRTEPGSPGPLGLAPRSAILSAMRRVGLASLGMAILVAVIPAGCGEESHRSAEAFCATMRSEQARILDQLNSTVSAGKNSGDEFLAAISGVGASIQALGELRTYFAKLSKVAPAEIQTEVEIVADSYEKQLDAASKVVSDPLAALSQAFMGGLTSSGQLNTVDSFARENCGEGV